MNQFWENFKSLVSWEDFYAFGTQFPLLAELNTKSVFYTFIQNQIKTDKSIRQLRQ